ncbi:cytochrome P450 [Nonomuraea longicatena]|uniref:Cytochrome P450 n=1 Tax=Nonomuraea longicatena TaxID=83682 RepID=A0ABN1NW59_9ACTN
MDTLPFDRPHALEPPPAYARLRAAAPLTPVRTPDGSTAWLVTSYDAAVNVLAERRLTLAPPGADTSGNDTLFQDGETHLRLRRLVANAFGPRAIAALVPRVERVADDLAAAVAASGTDADLARTLAIPLSITVIAELLGVAPAGLDRFRALAEAVSTADFQFGGPEEIERAQRAWTEFGTYAADLVIAKRGAPGADLISALPAAPGRISDAEVTAMVATVVSAGYLSAANAVSVAVLRLLTLDAPVEVGPAVVEEVLRMQAGRTGEPFPRYAQQDLRVCGTSIAEGESVLVRLEAVHRDPAHFPDPDRFLPGRQGSPPLVFGHGPHYCLGAALARAEVAAALGAVARRLPGLRLAVPLERVAWATAGTDTGPAEVPVTR